MKILFLGTSEFAAKPLQILLEHRFNIPTVITQPDKLAGRGKKITISPVKKLAKEKNLEILQPENINTDETASIISEKKFDVGIVISYGQIINKNIFNIPKYGILNLHPSLLPIYRGPSPIQTALLNNDKTTGVTVIKISEKMDAGPILMQEKININKDDNYFSLHDKLSQQGGYLLVKVLENMKTNNITLTEQNEELATYCRLITKNDGFINWSDTANNIHNKIRALCKWPVAYTYYNNKLLKIHESEIYSENTDISDFSPGTVIRLSKSSFGVVTGDKKILKILKVQLQGKKIISAKDFLNGINLKTGEILGN